MSSSHISATDPHMFYTLMMGHKTMADRSLKRFMCSKGKQPWTTLDFEKETKNHITNSIKWKYLFLWIT